MRFYKQDLLTLLVSLFIFSGCNDADSVGLEVDPDNAINGQLIDTSTVTAQTVREDSLLTGDLIQYPMGYMQDGVFGKTESSTIFTLNLPAATFTPGTSPVLDSAVLVLKYGDEFYGDSLSSQLAISVHQLNENFNDQGGYFNTKNWNFNPTAIGSKTIRRFTPRDSVRVTKPVTGGADSVLTLAPQMRIPISADFINTNFLSSAASSNFATVSAFQDFLKGLYVTINKSASSGPGSIGYFDLATQGQSQLELYYRNQTSGTIDTVLTTFPVSNNAAAAIKHDYTGTEVQQQLNNPGIQYTKTFVQPLAGLRTKVNLPFIEQLRSLGNIAVNKAELVVYIDQSTPVPYAPARRLTLYQNDIAGQRQPIPDGDTRQSNFADQRSLGAAFGGFYDTANQRYTFSLTAYLQDILAGRTSQYDLFLAPVDVDNAGTGITSVEINPLATTAQQSVLGSGSSTGYRMKLNILYTPQN